jgi:uncharacterized protein DUF6665
MHTDPIQHEIVQDKAAGLGRTEKRFVAALEAYWRQRASEHVVWELVESLTSFVVQREACGLRDARYVFDAYGVPREAIARIGVRRPRS